MSQQIKKHGFLIHAWATLHWEKDSSIALMQACPDGQIFSFYDLSYQQGEVHAFGQQVLGWKADAKSPILSQAKWYPISDWDTIWMRFDPPVNEKYRTCCQLLRLIADRVRVFNQPDGLLAWHEKCSAWLFPQWTPPTLLTSDITLAVDFIEKHQSVISKPLDGFGGEGVFQLRVGDPQLTGWLQYLLQQQDYLLLQWCIPDIAKHGDARILLWQGELLSDQVVLRLPKAGSIRANLAAGGYYRLRDMTDKEHEMVQDIKPYLKKAGLYFVGIDVINDYLTEINVTSPTCLRELSHGLGQNIAKAIWSQLI